MTTDREGGRTDGRIAATDTWPTASRQRRGARARLDRRQADWEAAGECGVRWIPVAANAEAPGSPLEAVG